MNRPVEAPRDRSGGRREVVFRRPHPLLRAHVNGYCGYLERGTGPTRRVEIPSAKVGLIIGFGPPVEIVHPRHRGHPPVRLASFLAGLHDSHAIVASAGWQYGVQVDLTPIGAWSLFGIPMHSLANRAVDLEEILGRRAALVAERLHEAPTWEARFGLIDVLVRRQLSIAHEEVSPAVTWAWQRLSETSGQLKIGSLADEFGLSRQLLVTRFREQIGLPPKTMARIVRFQRAVGLVQNDNRLDFSAIAHECGYYDQAHFNREFLELAGTGPTEYLARRLPGGAGVLCARKQ